MAKKFLFADEAGCFVFKKNGRASKYYILCTVAMDTCEIGKDLLDLRHRLSWEGAQLGDFFHCSPDVQAVRNEVFAVLQKHDFQILATIMEKSKAQQHVRNSEQRFYQYGWYYHLRHSAKLLLKPDTELHVIAATIGTKKKRVAFEDAVKDVCKQTLPSKQFRTSFWPCGMDPCLQVADYCTWAIQRKWETGCTLSYDLGRVDKRFQP